MTAQANIVVRLSDGRQAGNTLKELRQDANRLSKEINNLPVGSAEFVKKSKDLQQVNGRLRTVRQEINGVGKANNHLISSFAQYLPFGGHIQSMAGGLKVLTGATNGFGIALKAIPLLFLIGLIVKAVQWFAKTQAAMDGITSVTRPLAAIFQRFIGLVQELVGKWLGKLVDAFKNPQKAIKDLSNLIKENLIKRFEALGVIGRNFVKLFSKDWKSGLKGLADGFIQLNTGIEDATDKIINAGKATKSWIDEGIEAGTRLDKLQKSIEKQEIQLAKRRGELNDLYESSKEIAQDQSRTEEERLAAARKAQQAQNELEQLTLRFMDTKIEKMKLEHSLNDTSRADELEFASLEAERSQAAAQAARKRSSARNLENTINKQVAAEEVKRQKEIQKAYEERLKIQESATRNIQDLSLQLMKEGADKEIAQIELETDRKIEALVGSAELVREQKTLLEDLEQKRIQEVKDKYAEEEKAKSKQLTDDKIAQERKLEQAILEVQEAKKEAVYQSTNAIVESFGRESKAGKAALLIQKAAAISDVRASVEKQITAAAEGGSKIAAIAPPFTIPLGKIYTVAATAAAIGGGVSRIKNIQKAERGFIAKGKRHAQGGIPGVVGSTGQPIEFEDGEIILNRRVGLDPRGRKIASDLNVAYGGVPFELGGVINPFNSSGASSGSTINLESTNQRLDSLTSEFRMFSNRIDKWATNLKVNQNLQDVEGGLQTLNQLQNESGI